ncbi:MAG: enoyl-CoA hydratase-related protein [Acidimicrobiales bacterium]
MTHIRAERDGPVGTITIDNQSRRNAMTLDMYASIPAAVNELTFTPGLRCVVLRGSGSEAFCAGSNVAEFGENRTGPAASRYAHVEHDAFAAIAAMSVPTIAAIHGPCMGGGVALAASCDLRLAADDASFSVPPAKLGVGYAVDGVETLIRLIGLPATKMLILTATVIDAAEALRIDLVNQVHPKAALDDAIDDLTTRISRLAPLTLTAAKLAADGREGAAEAVKACFRSDDYHEGIAAFGEKRHPLFQGR